MLVMHCGFELDIYRDRELLPSTEEASRGVQKVQARAYWCQECRRTLYFKQELFPVGQTEWQRIKRNIGAFVRRLKRAKDSDWVLGSDPYTYMLVKRTVR